MTGNEKIEYRWLWRKCGLPSSPNDHSDFSSQIVVEQAVFEENNEFDGKIEYYGIQTGFHGSLCLRSEDSVKPDQAV